MEGKIREILERVRKGELSPEEAEELIRQAEEKGEARPEALDRLGQALSRIGEAVSESIAAVGRTIEEQGKWLEERKEQIEQRLGQEREPVEVPLEAGKSSLLIKGEVDAGLIELRAGETELALKGFSFSPLRAASGKGDLFSLKRLPAPEEELVLMLRLALGKAVLVSNRKLTHRLSLTMKGAAGEVDLSQAAAVLRVSLNLDASSLRLSLGEGSAGGELVVDAAASNLSLVVPDGLALVVQLEARASSHNLTQVGLEQREEGVFSRPGEGEPLRVRFAGTASLLRLFVQGAGQAAQG